MCNYEYPPLGGGAANATECLLKEFAGSQIKIDLVTSFAGKGIATEKLNDRINIYKVGIPKKNLHNWKKTEVFLWLFRAGKLYKKLLSENNYDLAHSYFAFPSGYLCYRHKNKLPYLISLRGSDVPGYNNTLKLEYFLLSRLFKSIWSNAGGIIANSKGLAELASKFTPEIGIKVIPNGVFTENFAAKNIYKAPNRAIKLLTVGRLVKRKRIDIAIKAVKLLSDAGVNIGLNIAGGGVMEGSLKALAEKIGVSDKVRFLGIVPRYEIASIYACADIFVMCSEHEGMSNAVLEAMASGLPIISSDCEGISELIEGNGIVLNQTDETTIAQSIEKLNSDPQLREKMGIISRQRAEQFSWKRVADAYINEYSRITAQNRQ